MFLVMNLLAAERGEFQGDEDGSSSNASMPGMSFLNIGSGTGYFNSLSGVNDGLELWPENVAYAQERCSKIGKNNIEFTVGNIYQLDINLGARYDRIYVGACACPRARYLYNLLEVGGVLGLPGVPFTFALRQQLWALQRNWAYPPQFRSAVAALLQHPSGSPYLPPEMWMQQILPWCPPWWFDDSQPVGIKKKLSIFFTGLASKKALPSHSWRRVRTEDEAEGESGEEEAQSAMGKGSSTAACAASAAASVGATACTGASAPDRHHCIVQALPFRTLVPGESFGTLLPDRRSFQTLSGLPGRGSFGTLVPDRRSFASLAEDSEESEGEEKSQTQAQEQLYADSLEAQAQAVQEPPSVGAASYAKGLMGSVLPNRFRSSAPYKPRTPG
ncbi:unnamed protein product [Polarella glacialis]|uniref:Methyltransferase domain-containing protein n=1 Tax=Polarella glacialis TaxID=89957 RepID=A0A813HJN6_POLGL|nr:unnamed protein product [Polarella glacialis]